MDSTGVIVTLGLVTLVGMLVIAVLGRVQTQQRLEESDTVKSTLAADKRSAGKPADV